VVGTMLWMIWGGRTHFSARIALDFPPGAWNWSWLFFAASDRRQSTRFTLTWGTNHICQSGRGNRQPERTSRARSSAVGRGIAVLYLAMQTSILGVLPWREAQIRNTCKHVRGAAVRNARGGVRHRDDLWIAFAFVVREAAQLFHAFLSPRPRTAISRYLRVCIPKTFSARLVALFSGPCR